ncbi:hypothetical protein Kisp02_58830 [Kineosporia sp. NBRC 101731]|nr:hypothetical protein Kisp02_58830 [Kineosporia sp. NBRC 101731]
MLGEGIDLALLVPYVVPVDREAIDSVVDRPGRTAEEPAAIYDRIHGS